MLAEVFDDRHLKIAFQNRLLIYLLYKCGGFIPSCTEIAEPAEMHVIPEAQIIQRHGTQVYNNLATLLSEELMHAVASHFGDRSITQAEATRWPGDYFGNPGSEAEAESLKDEVRQEWRKEYLPGPTALAPLSLCTAIAGLLLRDHTPDKRLRVTLHRTRTVGKESLLQQCCEYVGASIPGTKPAEKSTALTA
jgi:hypothetical protein